MWMPSPNQYWIRSKFNATSFSSRSFTIGSIEPTCSITWSLGSRNFWKQNILNQSIVIITNNFFLTSVNLFSKKTHSILFSVKGLREKRTTGRNVNMNQEVFCTTWYYSKSIQDAKHIHDELNEFLWLAHIYICCFSKK